MIRYELVYNNRFGYTITEQPVYNDGQFIYGQLYRPQREGQVPLAKLTDTIRKLPKKLEPSQITDVKARLRALDAVRPKVPLPRGPMPSMKGAKQAMRGR